MGYPSRFHDIDPTAVGLAYGLGSFLDERYRIDLEHKAKAAEKKARRRKALTVGLAAAGGAAGAVALGPALGLAGAAGAAGAVPYGTAAGTAVGLGSAVPLVGATAATSGVLGAGGVVGLGGALTGAAIGAQTGSAFFEGDYARGIGAVAAPFVAQQHRNMAGEDRAANRAALLQDAITLDDYRTANDVSAYRDKQSIEQYGVPYAEAIRLAESGYDESIRGAPMEGEPIGVPGAEMSVSSMGPIERPIPPGMEEKWTPKQYQALSSIEQKRAETVNDPEWIANHTPEQRMAHNQALDRARGNIKKTLVPEQPKPMYTNAQGQNVPIPLGVSYDKDGTRIAYDGKNIDLKDPTKAKEAVLPWLEHATTDDEAAEMKLEHFKAHHVGPIDPSAEYLWDGKKWNKETKSAGGGDDGVMKLAVANATVDESGKSKTVDTAGIVKNYETLVEAKRQIEDRMSLKKALADAVSRPPMQPISKDQYVTLLTKAVSIYGRNPDAWPDETKDEKAMLKQIDARLNPKGARRFIEGPR